MDRPYIGELCVAYNPRLQATATFHVYVVYPQDQGPHIKTFKLCSDSPVIVLDKRGSFYLVVTSKGTGWIHMGNVSQMY